MRSFKPIRRPKLKQPTTDCILGEDCIYYYNSKHGGTKGKALRHTVQEAKECIAVAERSA